MKNSIRKGMLVDNPDGLWAEVRMLTDTINSVETKAISQRVERRGIYYNHIFEENRLQFNRITHYSKLDDVQTRPDQDRTGQDNQGKTEIGGLTYFINHITSTCYTGIQTISSLFVFFFIAILDHVSWSIFLLFYILTLY